MNAAYLPLRRMLILTFSTQVWVIPDGGHFDHLTLPTLPPPVAAGLHAQGDDGDQGQQAQDKGCQAQVCNLREVSQ